MLYIYLAVLYYHFNIYVTEEAYAGRRGFLLSQRSFLVDIIFTMWKCLLTKYLKNYLSNQLHFWQGPSL